MHNGFTTEELTNDLILPIWNEKDLDVIDQFFSPNADIRTTFLIGKGPAALKESIQDTFRAFPEFKLTIEEIVQQADKVTYKWSARARHKGPILNIEPSGKELVFHGIVFGEISEKLITQYHSHSDIPQILYASLKETKEEGVFPSHTMLLNHENYDKKISDLLFIITKKTGAQLTRREVECLHFWSRRYSIKETARKLGDLSAKTIEVFRSNIRKKFEVRTYQELIELMHTSGILSLFNP